MPAEPNTYHDLLVHTRNLAARLRTLGPASYDVARREVEMNVWELLLAQQLQPPAPVEQDSRYLLMKEFVEYLDKGVDVADHIHARARATLHHVNHYAKTVR